MKVYIVIFGEAYEGDYIIDVYSSKEKADERAEKENNEITAWNTAYQKYVVVEYEVL